MNSVGDRPSGTAVFPRLRVGRRWLNLVWILPALALALGVLVVLAIWLRTLAPVQSFIADYPGSVANDAPSGRGRIVCINFVGDGCSRSDHL